MKHLLITHTDLDGISPIILMNLIGEKFEYKSIDISEVETTFNELFISDYKQYDNIYVTDLSLPETVYQRINELNIDNIRVFDHHHTHLFANENNYVNVIVDYDGIKTCGTEIFYKFLLDNYKELNKPNIQDYIRMVREADTFTFTNDDAKKLNALMSIIGKQSFIKSITRRLKKEKNEFTFTSFEKRLLNLELESVQRYIQKRETLMKTYLIDNYKCGVVFAEKNKSELGNYLSENHPELDLIVLIDASARVSYRTVKDDVDVSILASKHNGGGHQKASGSIITDEDRKTFIKYYFKEIEKI